MSARWIRTSPGRRENTTAALAAGAVAAGVGVAAFYLTRLLLSRDRLAGGEERLPERRAEAHPEVANDA